MLGAGHCFVGRRRRANHEREKPVTTSPSRREFLSNLGVGAAAAPFLLHLRSLGFASAEGAPKQRLVVMFSPNGVIPSAFWPDEEGETFTLKESRTPLERFKDRTLFLNGG